MVKVYHSREKHESRSEYSARALHEFHLLSSLHHHNIIAVLGYTSGRWRKVKIYMEAGSRDLAALLRSASPGAGEALCLWAQVVDGVAYLHGKGLCHRDLKLENLVLVGKILKIIDFDTACSTHQPAVGLVGSPAYFGPEVAAQIKYNGAKADVWSVAIILYVLMFRRKPWKSASRDDADFVAYVESRTVAGDLEAEFYERVLEPNPEARVSLAELQSMHWVASIASCGRGGCGTVHVML